MKKIIVTTDFSAESKSAYEVAMDLATALQAELHLIFISQNLATIASEYAASSYTLENPLWYSSPELQKQVYEAQKAELDNEAKLFPGFNIKARLIQTNELPSTEISKFAAEQKADYIVMSSHGRTGFAKIIMGSITERVLAEAVCPVVVVPTKHATK